MNEESIMPWGKHIGKKMKNIPAAYFLFLYDKNYLTGAQDVLKYITDRLPDLRKRAEYDKAVQRMSMEN